MSADWFSIVLQSFALPPGTSLALLFVALLSLRPKWRLFFLILGFGTLYLSSIPIIAYWLIDRVELAAPVTLKASAAEAIVVLGADRRRGASEYGGDTMNMFGLERLRYAAKLAKSTGLPILASGGCTQGDTVSEAELMGSALKEFGVEARWLENKSKNTNENAVYSSQILKGMGIGEVVLVTHSWHMARAVDAFEHAGMRVIPAPTGMIDTHREKNIPDYLPSASALQLTHLALHEVLGLWWYRIHYY